MVSQIVESPIVESPPKIVILSKAKNLCISPFAVAVAVAVAFAFYHLPFPNNHPQNRAHQHLIPKQARHQKKRYP